MGVLDGGVAAIFGAAFGSFYLDGTLVSSFTQPIYGPGGAITGYTGGTPIACKCQIDAATYAMRQADGFADGDMRIIVLSAGLGVPVTTDHRLTVSGQTWLIASADRDPAGSHWICRGRLA